MKKVKTFIIIYLLVLCSSVIFNFYLDPIIENTMLPYSGKKYIKHVMILFKTSITVTITYWLLMPAIEKSI